MGPSPKPRDREGGIFGLIGMVAALGALPLAPPWPPANADIDTLRKYFSEHGGQFLLQCIVLALGFVLLLRMYGGLARVIARNGAEGAAWTTLAGAAIMTLGVIAGNAPWAVLAYRQPASTDVFLALWDLGLFSAFTLVGPCIAACWLPLGIGVLRSRALPAAYGWAILATTPVHIAAGACTAHAGTASPNGPIALASVLVHVGCTIAGAILLLRKAT